MTQIFNVILTLWIFLAPLPAFAPIASPASISVAKTPILEELITEPLSIFDIIYIEGEKAGLSTKEMHRFYDIAVCESHLNPLAISKTGDHGLFQLHAAVWKFDWSQVYDAQYNTWYAKRRCARRWSALRSQ